MASVSLIGFTSTELRTPTPSKTQATPAVLVDSTVESAGDLIHLSAEAVQLVQSAGLDELGSSNSAPGLYPPEQLLQSTVSFLG